MKRPGVLIVEDDEWLVKQFERLLTEAGYRTRTVSHAIAAIQEVDDFHPDVIVLDILLSGSTAFALLHELQSYGDTGLIPVVVCTNIANEFAESDLRPYGVRKILDKTKMLPDDLVASVRSVL